MAEAGLGFFIAFRIWLNYGLLVDQNAAKLGPTDGTPPERSAARLPEDHGPRPDHGWIADKAHYLGKPGSREGWQEYHRLCAEYRAGTLDRPVPVRLKDMTVGQLVARFTAERVEGYYPAERSSEGENIRHAPARVTALYGTTPLARFGPRELKVVRDHMAGDQARTTANRNLGRVRQMLKWAVAEGFYPALSLVAIQAVEGLKAGRMGAREPKGVGPVPLRDVAATLPHLSAPVAAMVRLQILSGMRPGEVRSLCWADLDTAGDVWAYRPARHKSAWRGKGRVVMVGPQVQAELLPLRKADPDAPLFSPRDAVAATSAAWADARNSRPIRSELAKRAAAPGAGHGRTYSSAAYRHVKLAAKAGASPWPSRTRLGFG